MESFISFKPLTPRLNEIRGPVLLMNGEHDFFTPRECHELLRRELPNCRLMLIQHAYHAFTVELPDVTLRQLHEFLRSVDEGTWVGDGSVWIASDRADGEPPAFPCPEITCAHCRCQRHRHHRRQPASPRVDRRRSARGSGRAAGKRRPA